MSYRYIGNKTRVLPELLGAVRRICQPGDTIADLMCGTAAVSAALRGAGYTVLASDLLTFASYHARVRLKLARAPRFRRLDMTYEETLKHLMSLPLRRGLFVREYSNAGQPRAGTPPRSYLTGANAARVDAIRSKLRSWEDQHLLTMNEKALLRHDLVLAVNRVANIAGTYGHFRSSWSSSALRELVLTPSTFEAGRTAQHRIFQGPAERVADGLSADLCYLDPPYMKRQYAANYHLVETLARGDEPEAYGLSGLRDWWDQYSDFCSKRRLGDAFAAIFAKMDCGRFLVSYSEDGLFGREALMKMFSDFGSVTCYEFTNARFRSNAGGQGHRVTEYLFDLTVDRMT